MPYVYPADTEKTYAATEAKVIKMIGYGGLVLNFFGETGFAPKLVLPVSLIKRALDRGATVEEIKDEKTGESISLTLENYKTDNGGVAVPKGTILITDIEQMLAEMFEQEDEDRLKAIGLQLKEEIEAWLASDPPTEPVQQSDYDDQFNKMCAEWKAYYEELKKKEEEEEGKEEEGDDEDLGEEEPTDPEEGPTWGEIGGEEGKPGGEWGEIGKDEGTPSGEWGEFSINAETASKEVKTEEPVVKEETVAEQPKVYTSKKYNKKKNNTTTPVEENK